MLPDLIALLLVAVICVVDGDLAALFKELFNLVLDLRLDLLLLCSGLVRLGSRAKVIARQVLDRSEHVAAHIREVKHLALYAEPKQVALDGMGEVRLAARGQSDRRYENLTAG